MGVFANIANWWYADDVKQATILGQQLDSQIRREIERDRARLSQADYAVSLAHISAQEADTADYERQLYLAAEEGEREGYSGVSGVFRGIFDAAGAVPRALLGGVPWWLWVVGCVAVFVWLGGLNRLKGALAK